MKVDLLCFVFEGIFRFGLFSASKCTKGTLSLYLCACMCDSLSTCVYVCVCVGCIDTGRLISEPDLMHKMPPRDLWRNLFLFLNSHLRLSLFLRVWVCLWSNFVHVPAEIISFHSFIHPQSHCAIQHTPFLSIWLRNVNSVCLIVTGFCGAQFDLNFVPFRVLCLL